MFLAEEYARFHSLLKFANLPAEVVQKTKDLILDTLGVALAARQEESTSVACRAAGMWGSGDHVLWGFPEDVSILGASLVNGTMAHTLDYDDTHTGGIVHGSACIIPAAIAAAESRQRDGRELITAVVAGWELAARIGLAAPGKFHERGFHTTSVAGTFGATAAAAQLFALTEEQTVYALGISGSMVSGLNEYQSNESWPKRFHAGWASHNGIVASTLAMEGFTGPRSVFEGRDGLFRAYANPGEMDLGRLTAGLGMDWEILKVSVKPYPCCHFAHAIIDAIRELKSRERIAVGQIEKILCAVPKVAVPIICEPLDAKRNPSNSYGAKFSLPVIVSLTLTEPDINLDSFALPRIRRREILDLAQKVTYEIDPQLPFPKYFPGKVKIIFKGGKVLEKKWEINRGHPDFPLSEKDHRGKFLANVKNVFKKEDRPKRILAKVISLEDRAVKELTEDLRNG